MGVLPIITLKLARKNNIIMGALWAPSPYLFFNWRLKKSYGMNRDRLTTVQINVLTHSFFLGNWGSQKKKKPMGALLALRP